MIKKNIIFLISVFIVPLLALEIDVIEFEGNNLYTDAELKSIIISYSGMEYNQKTVLQDAQKISDFYEAEGLFLAKVYTPQTIPLSDEKVKIIFQIEENGKLEIEDVKLSGNVYLTDEFIFQSLKTRADFLKNIPQFQQEIVSLYNENAFYYAAVKADSISRGENERINLTLQISEGDYCQFDKAVFQGNEVTRNETILRLARLQDKEIITPRDLKQAEEKLKARPYITDCSILPVDSETLLYSVKEGEMTAFHALLGYDNDSDNEGRLLGYIDLNFENLWGTDRSIGFFWENREQQHSSIELRYHESGWKLPLAADFYLFRQEQDSTWIEVSFEAEVYWYDLFNKLGFYLKQENIYPGARRPQIVDKTEFTKAGGLWDYNNLNNWLNPSGGDFAEVKYYYIWSLADNKRRGRQALEMRYFLVLPLYKRWVQSFDCNLKVIEKKNLTDFDFFYCGGANSIRGYLENQFYGFRLSWLNLETRYLLSPRARISLNADLGWYENKNEDDFLFSVGFGLRLPTPLGLLGIDFALPEKNKRLSSFQEAILHVGLETRF